MTDNHNVFKLYQLNYARCLNPNEKELLQLTQISITQGIAISANDTSAFKAQSATKFIIHGFVSDGNEGWVKVCQYTQLQM